MGRAPRHAWFLVIPAALQLATAAAGAPDGPPAFDAERPRWSRLEFSASKFLLSADAQVEARLRPAATVAGELLTTPVGEPIMPGPEILELVYRASGLGRESVTTLWADPAHGATLQKTQLDLGERQRTYRFTDIGAYHFTRRPAGRNEKSLPPERWSDDSEGMRPFSPGAVGQPVTDATVLLWMVAAAELQRAGDQIQVLTFSRRHVNQVTARVAGRRTVNVDYTEIGHDTRRQRRGKLEVIVVQLRGRPVDVNVDDDEAFELLGLRGDLELLLEPASRVPLQLRGDVKIMGKLAVRLQRVLLR